METNHGTIRRDRSWQRERSSRPESIEWFIEDQAFSRSYDYPLSPNPLSHPPPPPPTYPSVSSTATHKKTEKKRQVADGWRESGGRGWASSKIIRPQESLVLHKQSILSVADPQEGKKIGDLNTALIKKKIKFSTILLCQFYTAKRIRFMYSQKWNCFPISTFMFCERFIYSQDRSAYLLQQSKQTDPGNK